MLKTILAISGKPGLYRLVSRGNKSLIVETVDDAKKRMPAFGADKVVSLADISIYTNDDSAEQDDIVAFFTKVLPNYDTDRVRVSDMRKVLAWYNLLVNYGITEFEEKKED